jgi:hypothetical protein
MVVLGTRLSGREFACTVFLSPSWPGEDPAIQFGFGAALPNLDHRVSMLRIGPVMTEKNQFGPKDGIKLPTFFVPDSSVLGTTIHEFRWAALSRIRQTRGWSDQVRP